jgi:hypothetical protein
MEIEEIKGIVTYLLEQNAENNHEVLEIRSATAYVEAIGVLVGVLGKIEVQLKRIADAIESLDKTGIETWTQIKK